MKRIISALLACLFICTIGFLLSPQYVSAIYNKAVISSYENHGVAYKKTSTTLSKVRGVKAKNISCNSLSLTWSPVSGSTGYRVYKYNANSKKITAIGNSSSEKKKISNLKAGTTYRFVVKAFKTKNNKKYWGAKSDVLTVKTVPKLTNSKLKSLYKKADKVYTGWLVPMLGCAYIAGCAIYPDVYYDDTSKNIEHYKWVSDSSAYENGYWIGASYVHHSSITTVKKLKKYLSKYFSKDIYERIVSKYYKDINGHLYYINSNWGCDVGDLKWKSSKINSQSGKTAKAKITFDVIMWNPDTDVTYTAYQKTYGFNLKYTDGRWVFEKSFQPSFY